MATPRDLVIQVDNINHHTTMCVGGWGGCWSLESLAVGEDPGGKDKHLAVAPSSQRGLKDVCSQDSLHFAGPPFNLMDLTKYSPSPHLVQSHCFPSFDLRLPFVSVIPLFPN